MQAFGLRGGLRVHSPDGGVTERKRQEWPGGPGEFDAWSASADRQLSRAVLRGPSDGEEADLRAAGWDPSVARKIATERAEFERELESQLQAQSRWRRGRLRNVVAARYLANDAWSIFVEAAAAHELPLTAIGTDVHAARGFTDSMPSADVRISLLTAAHRNAQTQWTSNDIFDVDALSVAVPYCDVVVTERHAHHVLHAAGLPQRLGTTVLATLDELSAVLVG